MVRSPCIDKNGMKKGAWSVEEDKKLRDYIQRYGHWNWRELPKFAGLSRCGKSCRLRWMNYLRPNVKRGNYTKEEDDTIIKLRQELGNKWSVISGKLPGRTDNEIKNHWHTHLKKLGNQNRMSYDDQEQSNEPTQIEENQSHETSQFEENQEDQSNETSQFEANQKIDFIPENVVEIVPSTSQSASSEFSSLSLDYSLFSDLHWDAEISTNTTFESFEELSGSFWSEPFLADTSCNLDDVSTSSLVGGGFSSSYFTYDDSIDLFYQLMQDFQTTNKDD